MSRVPTGLVRDNSIFPTLQEVHTVSRCITALILLSILQCRAASSEETAGKGCQSLSHLPFWAQNAQGRFFPFSLHDDDSGVPSRITHTRQTSQSSAFFSSSPSICPASQTQPGKAACSAAALSLHSDAAPSAGARLSPRRRSLISRTHLSSPGRCAQSSLCPLVLFHRCNTSSECTAEPHPEQ